MNTYKDINDKIAHLRTLAVSHLASEAILTVCDFAEHALPTRAEEMEAQMFVNQLMTTHSNIYEWANVKSWLRRMLSKEPSHIEHRLLGWTPERGAECSCGAEFDSMNPESEAAVRVDVGMWAKHAGI
jgi:hypothetical protein